LAWWELPIDFCSRLDFDPTSWASRIRRVSGPGPDFSAWIGFAPKQDFELHSLFTAGGSGTASYLIEPEDRRVKPPRDAAAGCRPRGPRLIRREVGRAPMQFFVGTILLVAFCLAFWLALPRDGKVRSFLRNDQTQAYYTVAMIAALAGGVLNVVLGLIAMIG
jgi:hypothetical protein